jgi:phenylalanyl-tRNA synthetase beta chain
MKVSYEWLQTFFEEGVLPSADALAQTLIFHAYEVEGVEEVDGDTVLDVDVLPNRSSDSLSHRGIAREISTLLRIPLRDDPLRAHVELTPVTQSITVALGSGSCSRYVAAHITGVKVGPSPDWLRKRLEAIGQKSINNVVDATNYVLFSIGQPTHVFDAQKFSGEKPHVGTRRAKKGENIMLLGEEEATELTDIVTVITDENSGAAVAVAGVKGGTRAEVDENTTDIIIESAKFDPMQTRLAAQALRLRTDASTRFENDVPDEMTSYGIVAVVKLILDIAGGELTGFASAGDIQQKNKGVTVTAEEASRVLGVQISPGEIEDIFTRLGFKYTYDGERFVVVAPFERRDVHIPEDVIEEIGRVFGYEKVPAQQLPDSEPTNVYKKFAYAEKIRNVLTDLGLTEVYLYSLRDSGEVRLENSLASDKDHLRADLSTGIIESLDKVEKHMPLLGLYDAVKIFEIGNVFTRSDEETHVCAGVRVVGTKKREERTHEALKKVRNTLSESLDVTLPEPNGETLEFNLDAILDTLPDVATYTTFPLARDGIRYTPSSQYPFALRDIAVWMPAGAGANDLKELIEKHSGDLLARIDLFDSFEKDGRVSYAFHLVFQSMDETLTDGRVGDIMYEIEMEITNKKDWEIR